MEEEQKRAIRQRLFIGGVSTRVEKYTPKPKPKHTATSNSTPNLNE